MVPENSALPMCARTNGPLAATGFAGAVSGLPRCAAQDRTNAPMACRGSASDQPGTSARAIIWKSNCGVLAKAPPVPGPAPGASRGSTDSNVSPRSIRLRPSPTQTAMMKDRGCVALFRGRIIGTIMGDDRWRRRDPPPTLPPTPAIVGVAGICWVLLDGRSGGHQNPVGVTAGAFALKRPTVFDELDAHRVTFHHIAVGVAGHPHLV